MATLSISPTTARAGVDVVTLTGSGFTPGERIRVQYLTMMGNSSGGGCGVFYAAADGSLSARIIASDFYPRGARLVSAQGVTSGVQATAQLTTT